MAITRPRSRALWVPAATIASEVGNSAAAPTPAIACPIHKTSTRVLVDVDAPGVRTETSSPAARISAPPTSSRLRPKRSPSTPNVSSKSTTGTRNASEIQVSCEELVPRSSWNRPLSTAGIASATCPTATAIAEAISVPVVRSPTKNDPLAAGVRGLAARCSDIIHAPLLRCVRAVVGESRSNRHCVSVPAGHWADGCCSPQS